MDRQLLRPGLAALAQHPQEPRAGAAPRTPEAAPRKALHQPAFAKPTLGIGDAGWRRARPQLVWSWLALLLRFAMRGMPRLLEAG